MSAFKEKILAILGQWIFRPTGFSIIKKHPAGALDEKFKAVQQRNLARQYLLPGERQIEPGGTVDLGNLHHATTAPRPFDRDHIAAHRVHIEIALQCEGVNDLSGPLTYVAKRDKCPDRLNTKFFLELASRRDLRILAASNSPLGMDQAPRSRLRQKNPPG
jgi:hypothetical protein